ncbi:centrosomal protein of 83 kDa-like isoform X2 [Clavelina lepadiformis]
MNDVESSEQTQELIQNLQAQLASKCRELEEVRSQTLHPGKLEIIKAEVTKELEEPLKAHMLAMDREVEKYRGEYNKLRYENTFLKAEYEHAKAEHQRNLEEQNLRHQALVAALKQERDDLLKNQHSTTDVDAQKITHLQRNKNQLEQRVKNLLDEMAELRKQKEHVAVEADSVQRSQAKDLARLQANIKAIESEKRSNEMQCERLQKELWDSNEQKSRLTQQIKDLNKECTSLRNSLDEETHRHKVELTNGKLETLKMKGELERDRDSLASKNHELEAELDILRASTTNHQRELEEAERESSRRILESREEEWTKNNSLQNEKLQLEERCRELEQRLASEKSSRTNEREQNEDKMRALEMDIMSLKNEISQLKVRLAHETQTRQQYERDRDECVTLRQKIHDRESELQAMTSHRQQALAEAERAREAIRDVRSDAEAARMQAQRAQSEAEKSIEAHKIASMEEKHRIQTRLDQVEHKLKRFNENHERANRQQRKMKQAMLDKIKHLKGKVQLLEAEKEKLEIEMKAGRHGVSLEEHHRLKRRMREVTRRHNEFRRVVGLGENLSSTMNTLHADMTSFNMMGLGDLTNLAAGGELEKQHQKELSLIRKRLDEVEMQQQEQNDVFDAIGSTRPEQKMDENLRSNVKMDTNQASDEDRENRRHDDENKSTGSGSHEYDDDFESRSTASSKS